MLAEQDIKHHRTTPAHAHESSQSATGGAGAHDSFWVLSLGALGVVFGDIGTSPLYAFRECFSHNIEVSPENIIGILSLIFWTLMVIVCLKYMLFVLRADNKGEGGILSLMALAIKTNQDAGSRRIIMVALGLFGAALLYGDGVITPAISVLSAVEGLKVVTPMFSTWVVPLTVIVIAILFLAQFVGTGRIGAIFGPIIAIWFISIGGFGLWHIVQNPEVLLAISPVPAIRFFFNNGQTGFFVLGAVFLAVTGAEALYADMGHFGKKPIQFTWFTIALPSLILNYFGQGALVLTNKEMIENPFFLMVPQWALAPMVILATAATVIASQALISGVFSVTRQAVQLGFWPRLSIVHTSSREIGQIYIPFINWSLMLGVIWLVISFKTSGELASAYGIAVTGTMLITTILAYEVARQQWKWSFWAALSVFGFFAVIDIGFFVTNIVKIESGGWVPLTIGAIIYLLMSTWQKGRKILAERLMARSIPIQDFIVQITLNPPLRVDGSAIYMSSDVNGVPVPLLHNLKHNKVLHSQVAILTIKTREVPFVVKNRVEINEVHPKFYQIIAYYGFMETPKIKHILEACRERGIKFSVQETTFVLGRETILPRGHQALPVWREKIFAFMARNAERPTAYFRIPPNQVIEVGIQVEI